MQAIGEVPQAVAGFLEACACPLVFYASLLYSCLFRTECNSTNAKKAREGIHPNSDRLTRDAILGLNPVPHPSLTHLRALEAESIHILREVVAEFQKPVML